MEEFADEEGIAFGAGVQISGEPGRVPLRQPVVAPAHECADGLRVQRPQDEAGRTRLAHEERQRRRERGGQPDLLGAIRDEDEDGMGGEITRDDTQQCEAAGVRPMQVVQQ